MKNNQNGFGALGVIAVIVVVLTLGGIGYAVYNKRIQKNSTEAATTPSVNPPKITDPTPTPAGPTDKGASLTIKEWSITIPLPEALNDAYYVVSTSSVDADGSPNTVWVGLKSLPVCAPENGNIGKKPLASITRSSPDYREPVSGELYRDTHPNGLVVDRYYYAYSTRDKENSNCASQEVLQKVDEAFKTSIKSAKKSPDTL